MTRPPPSPQTTTAVGEHLNARVRDLEMLYQYDRVDAEILTDVLISEYGFDADDLAAKSTLEIWEEVEALQSQYGLSFDYVRAGTFEDQPAGYFRYQLSYGGPSEEFRFFVDPEHNLLRAEFWLLDWFTGSSVDCTHHQTVRTLWDHMLHCETSHIAFAAAMSQ